MKNSALKRKRSSFSFPLCNFKDQLVLLQNCMWYLSWQGCSEPQRAVVGLKAYGWTAFLRLLEGLLYDLTTAGIRLQLTHVFYFRQTGRERTPAFITQGCVICMACQWLYMEKMESIGKFSYSSLVTRILSVSILFSNLKKTSAEKISIFNKTIIFSSST